MKRSLSQAIYNSIIFNFMKDRDSFGERVSPTLAIRTILHGYPFSASILRELLQRHGDGRSRSSSYARAGQAYVERITHAMCAHTSRSATHQHHNLGFQITLLEQCNDENGTQALLVTTV